MARPRFEKLDPERQEKYLAAAAEEFATHGFEAASLNRIIERADTNKGSLYYYFEDKQDLLATAVQRAVCKVLTEMDFPHLESLTKESFWEQMREALLQYVPSMEAETWFMRLLRAFWRLREEEAARNATAGLLDWTRNFTREFIVKGQQLGTVRTDLPLDLMLEMFLAADQAGDRWMMERWHELNERERTELIDARLDFARDMLDSGHMGWER